MISKASIILMLLASLCSAGLSTYRLSPVLDAITEYMNKQAEYVAKKHKTGTWKQIGFKPDLASNLGYISELKNGAIAWNPDYDARTDQYSKCRLIIDPSIGNFESIKEDGGFNFISWNYVDRANKEAGNRKCEDVIEALMLSGMDAHGEIMGGGSFTPKKLQSYDEALIENRSKSLRNIIWHYIRAQVQYMKLNLKIGSFKDLNYSWDGWGVPPELSYRMQNGGPQFSLITQSSKCNFLINSEKILRLIIDTPTKGLGVDSMIISGYVIPDTLMDENDCENIVNRMNLQEYRHELESKRQ